MDSVILEDQSLRDGLQFERLVLPLKDKVNLFESMGIDTGINLKRLCKINDYCEKLLGRTLPGKMSRVLKMQQRC